ncbi:VOC family protein [Nocardioides sp.]|uniref:VOC family protein n=1 Tax=Nocardioides sp. TaxID=35761 RepID=UPI002D1C04E5|nr:VOC family protein [Nocardioides sp.]HXH76926.1 VOC family protein [Nocardioides sp.]
MIGRLAGIVIDCPEPRALAEFYQELLGAKRVEDSAEWVTLSLAGGLPSFSLQRTDRYQAPDWNSGLPPQQMHLDVLVDNLDTAEAQVLSLGGTLLDGSDKPIGFRVYADPVGHPFCLVTSEGLT